ncbi:MULTISPECIES: bifunctional UDP-sugar hydrolase/5'-nucleotidase [Rhodococcus]|jgi:5'-nucleotidase|uniref:bifunctional metallophosphatase/5'-nucleotidase n=1 Tax=Rhodococcus TaxID=1827 RepID=UPI00163ABFE4|nr:MULTISPECIES: bifunctional UDP-sugar hydrolase/5'-nucleotidase [Rhodococcus]MBC2590599.1 bifunctional metallophosphatase/5'-nucleotidase [Rhodococcus aetherivorans]QSE59921.1 bifunctional metallophosphatase/5'-nucleotidase [Rhodococcus sp. PSBB066]QSE68773.1 bifunctional metallophosphatase/5'-nucleotidase [Rhodococcus sp. PSBB049]
MGSGVARRWTLSAALLTGALWTSLAVAPATAIPPDALPLRLIAFRDLHGSLLPPQGPRSEVVRSDGASVPAGGAAYLAAYVRQLRSQADNSVLYSVGDTWGSSPIESAMFHDEPTVDLLNGLDVTAAALGNHEFDNGYAELQRLRDGGCHPEGCRYDEEYAGATFPLIAANVADADGSPAALPFTVDYVDGVPVGVIGIAPHDTPQVVRGDDIAGLQFTDEITAVDRTADALDALGIRSIVLLYKGALTPPAGTDPCDATAGPARSLATQVSPKVDVIVTADGDDSFNCSYPDPAGSPRTVLQGASHGRIISVADLTIDRESRDVLRDRTHAFNQIVTHDIAPDPRTQQFVDRAVDESRDVAERVVGRIAADLTRDTAPSGESALGNLVADAQLAAAEPAGAQLALTNPGGVRADLLHSGDGVVTYGDAYAAQPFGNRLQVLELTGAELVGILEQQFQQDGTGAGRERILAPSHTLRYVLDRAAAPGSRIRDVTIADRPLDAAAAYRVVVNGFLAEGGDGFTGFTQARRATGAGAELDALNDYLAQHAPVPPPATDRIALP